MLTNNEPLGLNKRYLMWLPVISLTLQQEMRDDLQPVL